jgi:hypothetical protein
MTVMGVTGKAGYNVVITLAYGLDHKEVKSRRL